MVFLEDNDVLPALKSGVSSKGGRHISIQFIPALKGRGFFECCYKPKKLKGQASIFLTSMIRCIYQTALFIFMRFTRFRINCPTGAWIVAANFSFSYLLFFRLNT